MEVEMKDSGIPWVGKIPKNWEISKLKFCTDIIMGQSPNSDDISDEGKILFMQGNAEFEAKYPKPKHYCDKATKHSRMGDILMSVRAPVGALNFSNSIYGIGRGLCSIKPIKIETDYLWYFLQKSKSDFDFFSNGSTFDAITITVLKNFNIAIPPSQIQQQIANFLDDKCADIDQLITLQQQMIDELKAYKQSVITEAVCKGLDKSVPMKDSGIEWIGEVPEGWKISKVKQLFKVFNGSTPKSDNMDFWGGEITWITPVDMYNNQEIYSSIKTITELGYKSCGTTLLPENSIILSTRAPIGQVSMNKVPLCTNQGCKSLVAKNKNNTKYYFYYFQVQTNVLNMLGRGTTFLELSTTDLNNFILPVPGIDEQNIIVSYLDQKSSKIDTLISIKQQKMDELKEYKKSMIYEYITGKKQVSNN